MSITEQIIAEVREIVGFYQKVDDKSHAAVMFTPVPDDCLQRLEYLLGRLDRGDV